MERSTLVMAKIIYLWNAVLCVYGQDYVPMERCTTLESVIMLCSQTAPALFACLVLFRNIGCSLNTSEILVHNDAFMFLTSSAFDLHTSNNDL